MATRLFNPFPKKGVKREPAQNLRPQVPQRDAEPEEFINEYEVIVEIEAEENQAETPPPVDPATTAGNGKSL